MRRIIEQLREEYGIDGEGETYLWDLLQKLGKELRERPDLLNIYFLTTEGRAGIIWSQKEDERMRLKGIKTAYNALGRKLGLNNKIIDEGDNILKRIEQFRKNPPTRPVMQVVVQHCKNLNKLLDERKKIISSNDDFITEEKYTNIYKTFKKTLQKKWEDFKIVADREKQLLRQQLKNWEKFVEITKRQTEYDAFDGEEPPALTDEELEHLNKVGDNIEAWQMAQTKYDLLQRYYAALLDEVTTIDTRMQHKEILREFKNLRHLWKDKEKEEDMEKEY